MKLKQTVAGLALVAALASAAAPALAAGREQTHAQSQRPATIFAADLGGIRNWRADGRDALLIESTHDRWYRATFFGPCSELRFADRIGFVTSPAGELDRFSSILVGRHECQFRTFDAIPAPPAHASQQRGH